MSDIISICKTLPFTIKGSFQTEGRQGTVIPPHNLNLSAEAKRLFSGSIEGLFKHQAEALSRLQRGEDVCLSTSTASGKSLVFQIGAIDILAQDPKAKILAIYPLKALAKEQEMRWNNAFETAGLACRCGRIDGSVEKQRREHILRECSVVSITPDVLHAWFLSQVGQPIFKGFLKNLRLLVVDEAHTFTGVFGTNSAFLFRRLNHLTSAVGGRYQTISASATMADPATHLQSLLGRAVSVVDSSFESSPKHPLEFIFLEAKTHGDLLNSSVQLLVGLCTQLRKRSLMFMDSRKQVEQAATIALRDEEIIENDDLKRLILPYRAGYEDKDREAIQAQLSCSDEVRAVISTSALELGLDIPNLEVVILYGVPNSATSLYQRIGRIGRNSKGYVIVLNDTRVASKLVFQQPSRIMELPLQQGALYLDNPRIQYIHAMCLARHGTGEHDQVSPVTEDGISNFSPLTAFPKGFLELCDRERTGDVPRDLEYLRITAGQDPNRTFPLRDCDAQFVVEVPQLGLDPRPLGSLTYSQVMREAYPGAIYYYNTKPYRVIRVEERGTRKIVVQKVKKRYTTKPKCAPSVISPNLSSSTEVTAYRIGELGLIKAPLYIIERVVGYKEMRGSSEHNFDYPLQGQDNCRFNYRFFQRAYLTSGVLITHTALDMGRAQLADIAETLLSSFLSILPFERRDVDCGSDQFRVDKPQLNIGKGRKFLAIYDSTYGSLRLTDSLIDAQLLRQVFERSLQEMEDNREQDNDDQGVITVRAILESLEQSPANLTPLAPYETRIIETDACLAIAEGSSALYPRQGDRIVFVHSIFYSPKLNKLCYRTVDQESKLRSDNQEFEIIPIDALEPIEGLSEVGTFDEETGRVIVQQG